MKQRYEIPLPLDEVKERLRADMQTDWPLGKLLRSVKRPANDRRGLYGQIEGERLWAVMMHGYDMYPKRVFFGTLRAQGDHTILEGGFRYPMQVLLKLAVLLAWILFENIFSGLPAGSHSLRKSTRNKETIGKGTLAVRAFALHRCQWAR